MEEKRNMTSREGYKGGSSAGKGVYRLRSQRGWTCDDTDGGKEAAGVGKKSNESQDGERGSARKTRRRDSEVRKQQYYYIFQKGYFRVRIWNHGLFLARAKWNVAWIYSSVPLIIPRRTSSRLTLAATAVLDRSHDMHCDTSGIKFLWLVHCSHCGAGELRSSKQSIQQLH